MSENGIWAKWSVLQTTEDIETSDGDTYDSMGCIRMYLSTMDATHMPATLLNAVIKFYVSSSLVSLAVEVAGL
jgi:hypothetical protein